MSDVATTAPDVMIRENAFIDPKFKAGIPGTYRVAVTIEGVPLSSPSVQYFDPSRWTQAFADRGFDVRCTGVGYGGTKNARSENPALDIIEGIFGSGYGDRNVADQTYFVTLDIRSFPDRVRDGTHLGGVSWAAAVGVLLVAAVVFTAISYFTGKNLLVDSVVALATAVGQGVAAIVKPTGEAVSSSIVVPVLLVGGLVFAIAKYAGGFRGPGGLRVGGRGT